MGAQTGTACLASHLSLATLVIIRVLSAWLSEIPLHLNLTLSLAHLDVEILIPILQMRKSRDCPAHNLPSSKF